jgi:hypothetical protein
MSPSDTEFDKFDKAMDTILKADPTRVKAQMEADRKANAEARANKRFEALVDKRAKKFAKQMGPVHMSVDNDPVVKVFNDVMKKQRLRKVN